jgi:biopolymer transport protein ExbB
MLLLFLSSASVCEAQTWWNEQWGYRKKITFDTSPAGADIKENLTEVPVLIRLHSGNFAFANAQQNGEDLRFVASDEKTVLKHHIERFDPLEEMAIVWVKVPRLSGGSAEDYLWMYYGNKSAVGGQDSKGTYDVKQVVVYHLGETEGPPKDATAYENHPSKFSGGQGLPSVIGNGVSLNGAGDLMVIPASPSLNFTGGFTLSLWVRVSGPVRDAHLFSLEDEKASFVVGVDGTKVYARLVNGKAKPYETEKTTDLSPGTWHHLAITVEPKSRMSINLDGIEMSWVALPVEIPEFKADLVVGGSKKGDRFFAGELDEIRISSVARPLGWIRAAFVSQAPEGKLLAVHDEEVGGTGGGLPLYYLKIVVKNITLDGWIIIGILLIMAVLSWLVFFAKAFFLMMNARENRGFMEAFTGASGVLDQKDSGDRFQNSPLYRIYQAGQVQLQSWIGNPGHDEACTPKILPKKAMAAFRAALERGFVTETQKLNSWLVLLTMAITGGPFLGLLGTVWGVMNTFAAMAEAGEANIMAIAPGVASALATTVFGLIVAIPALFTYNYLATKVRNLTSELSVFIDQYAVLVEGTHGGES